MGLITEESPIFDKYKIVPLPQIDPANPVAPLYAGGGARLAGDGALFGGDLSPWQGRLLLSAALAVDPRDPAGVLAGRL